MTIKGNTIVFTSSELKNSNIVNVIELEDVLLESGYEMLID